MNDLTQQHTQEFWNFLDASRDKMSPEDAILQWLDQTEAPELFYEILSSSDTQKNFFSHSPYLTPKPLADFVARISQGFELNRILDPVCGTGLLLKTVSEQTGVKNIQGIDLNTHSAKIAARILGEEASITFGDIFQYEHDPSEPYDLIIADPPLKVRWNATQKENIRANLGAIYDFPQALILWTSRWLSPTGSMLVVAPPSFFFKNSQSQRFHRELIDRQLAVTAIIHLPVKTLSQAAIESYLLIIERSSDMPQQVFVGSFQEDPDYQKELIRNFRKQKFGRAPSLGRLVALDKFVNFNALVAQEQLKELTRNRGLHAIPGEELLLDFETINRNTKRKSKLVHGTPSCYLSTRGRIQAGQSISELPRSSSVVHLHINPQYAQPAYLVHWFNNTEIGQKTLATQTVGVAQPNLNARQLITTTFYLPELNEQNLVIEGQNHLTKLQAILNDLEEQLWSGENIPETIEAIKFIKAEDGLEDWIETLPFPLASILRRAYALSESPKEKYETLLHFFEATAEFLTTIHLSTLINTDLWDQIGVELVEKLSENEQNPAMGTFGLWNFMAEFLSSRLQKILNSRDEEQFARVQAAYQTRNRRILAMLSNPKLRTILQTANSMRNQYGGHPGAIGPEIARQILANLETLVDEIRSVFGRKWMDWPLIMPENARVRNGLYYYSCKSLQGTNWPFKKEKMESTIPLESDELYLFDIDGGKGLKLLPLVYITQTPQKQAEACFFYNRQYKNDMFRFVSYHFEQEPDIEIPHPALQEFLSKLIL